MGKGQAMGVGEGGGTMERNPEYTACVHGSGCQGTISVELLNGG